MSLAELLIVLSAVYLAPHLDAAFARVLSAGCVLAAVAVVVLKVLL